MERTSGTSSSTARMLNWARSERCWRCGSATGGGTLCEKHAREADEKMRADANAFARAWIDENLEAAMRRVGVPDRYVDANFAKSMLPRDVINAVMATTSGSAYLYGVAGSGKTWCAAAAVRLSIERAVKAYAEAGGREKRYSPGIHFIVVPEFLARRRAMRKEDAWRLDGIVSCGLVVLDELGLDHRDFGLDLLYNVINGVYNRRGKTRLLVTSNHTLNEIAEMTHDRLSSRLFELCTTVEFPDVNLRVKMRKNG